MQLNQVFMNLLVNAGHAIPEKGDIFIRTWADDVNLYVQIRDTGVGIPPENRSRIFEPFFTTKEVGKGTGLGLSMAYDIVKKHHGKIEVESEVGQGTAFTVGLPQTGVSPDEE
jgi:two-component system NtrC family sensor kinase